MKVNFNVSIKDFKGNEVTVGDKPMLFSDRIAQLLFNYGNKTPVPADDKWLAYKLCNRVANSDVVELTTEEGAFILKICGEYLTAGAYGQIRELIENNH